MQLCCPPFGLSDHDTVVVSSKTRDHNRNFKKVIIKRDQRASCKATMGRYLNLINWPLLLAPWKKCEDMWNVFFKVIYTGLDLLMPLRRINVFTADAPWMNQNLKSLIKKRQNAFNTNGLDSTLFKYYRNLVNRERKACRAKYYESKIQCMKGKNSKK